MTNVSKRILGVLLLVAVVGTVRCREPSPGSVLAETPTHASADAGTDGGTLSAAEGLCTADGFCWIDPLPQGNGLNSIWGSSSTDVWVAGSRRILHWDGQKWNYELEDQSISSVFGSGLNDVWTLSMSPSDGLEIHRWNGQAWAKETLEIDPSGRSSLSHIVPGSGPDNIWVYGTYGINADNVLFQWNGTSWKQHKAIGQPFAVLALSPTNLWICGRSLSNERRGVLAHFDGANWTMYPAESIVSAIWGLHPERVWAGGVDGLKHWSGGPTWTAVPEVRGQIRAIWGASDTDVWAMGSAGTFHYDGSVWKPVPSVDSAFVSKIWGSTASDVWAVGEYGQMMHFDGAQWTMFSQNLGPTSYSRFPPNSEIFARSENDVWFTRGDTLLRWDGRSTTRVSLPFESLSQLTGNAGEVWIASSDGQAARWDGSAWLNTRLPRALALMDLWTSGVGDVWAVTNVETAPLFRWTGSEWKTVALPNLPPIANLPKDHRTQTTVGYITGTSGNDVWVVGTVSDVHEPIGDPAPATIYSIWIMHWDGEDWSVAQVDDWTETKLSLYWAQSAGPGRLWILERSGMREWSDAPLTSTVLPMPELVGSTFWIESPTAIWHANLESLSFFDGKKSIRLRTHHHRSQMSSIARVGNQVWISNFFGTSKKDL